MEHQKISLGAGTFDVVIDGPASGVPVVLLHGFPQSAASWTAVSSRLAAAGLRTYALQQRGYSAGARPEGVEAYAMEELVSDVVNLIDASFAAGPGTPATSSAAAARVHLVGHDWGAAVAWAVAAWHPERLLSLTAVSVPHLAAYNEALAHDADQQQRGAYIGLLRQPGKAEDLLLEDDAARLRAMYGTKVPDEQVEAHLAVLTDRPALTAALNWYRAMTPALGSLGPVAVPTTFIWGDDDLAIGRYGAERCGDHVTGDFRFVALEGGSHWVPEEHPDVIADEVLRRAAADEPA